MAEPTSASRSDDGWLEIDTAYSDALEHSCTCGEGEQGELHCPHCNRWEKARSMLKKALIAAAVSEQQQRWIPVGERLPDAETPVLILFRDKVRIGELRWERPGYEDTFLAYQYWDDPFNDGQDWDWPEITDWQPLPEPRPGERNST